MTTSELTTSLQNAPIIQKGKYHYIIHPLTDGIPSITPKLLTETTQQIINKLQPFLPVDRIVTIEAMGIPLATMVSTKLNIPLTIIRKRSYGLPNEVSIAQTTGYSQSNLFINGLHKNDTIAIVDDVLSTGGTLTAILTALKTMHIHTKTVIIAINKGTQLTQISQKFNIPIQILTTISVDDGILKIHK